MIQVRWRDGHFYNLDTRKVVEIVAQKLVRGQVIDVTYWVRTPAGSGLHGAYYRLRGGVLEEKSVGQEWPIVPSACWPFIEKGDPAKAAAFLVGGAGWWRGASVPGLIVRNNFTKDEFINCLEAAMTDEEKN